MFYTGAFSLKLGACSQKPHEKEHYNDDVISWFTRENTEEQNMYSDGYVSNKGAAATIQLRDEYRKETDIEAVKSLFGLYEKNDVAEVKTVSFPGWDIELFTRGINKGPFRVLNRDDCGKAETTFIIDHNQEKDIFRCAVQQAWLDMCRTLEQNSGKKKKARESAKERLAGELKRYFEEKPKKTVDAFDGWYGSVVSTVLDVSHNLFRVGQAQKLVNMAFKYLFCCEDLRREKAAHFTYCHMPLDKYTLRWYKENVDQSYDGTVWSKIDTINDYKRIVGNIRNRLGSKNVLTGEFKIWQEEKKKEEIKQLKSSVKKITESYACSPELKEMLKEYENKLTAGH